jgi:mannose-6-phosphate isomerase-like protein (cupin superfamily)
MASDNREPGDARVLGPDEGESYWQPVPANGYVRNLFNAATIRSQNNFAIGTQTVAPGCFVREHTHDRNEEMIVVVSGKGFVKLDGKEFPLEVGSSVFIGHDRKHQFINPGPEPLTFVYFLMPGGLEHFFAQIGRKRIPGEPAPEPFARPDNIAEIEARTVFGWTDKDFANKPQRAIEPA